MRTKNKITSIFLALTLIVGAFFMSVNVQASTIHKGVDVFEYDNISDYHQLKSTGIEVLIQKATQGLRHNDSLLQYRYTHATQEGFKIGFYHYADNSGQPVAEAQHFLAQIQGLHTDTVLWLDIENQPDWTKGEAIDYTNQFINYVQAQGYKIGVYTGLSFYYEYLHGNIPNVPMWLASYGRQPLQFPNLVSWQYSDQGNLPGVIGDIDLDYFNDSIFTGQTQTQIVQTPIQPQYINGYNVEKVKSLQTLLNGLGLRDNNGNALAVDGDFGTLSEQVAKKLPIAKINNYHNEAFTNWIESQFGKSQDGIFYTDMNNTVRNFQAAHGLEVDGKVGINTLKELLK